MLISLFVSVVMIRIIRCIRSIVQPVMDATFLLTGAILLLLSYIFRHGEQLQQLSDETL